MFTMALAGRAVTAWAGAPDAVVEFGVRFSRPVPVPDTDEGTEVVVSGVVKEVTEDGLTKIGADRHLQRREGALPGARRPSARGRAGLGN